MRLAEFYSRLASFLLAFYLFFTRGFMRFARMEAFLLAPYVAFTCLFFRAMVGCDLKITAKLTLNMSKSHVVLA